MKSIIETILSKSNNYYVMGTGGEGIEFFSNLLSTGPYTEYKKTITTQNRHFTHIPEFYNYLASIITYERTNKEFLLEKMVELLMNDSECQSLLNEALSLINSKFVYKMHFCNNEYFDSSNTLFIYLDTEEWFRYKWYMWFCKVWVSKIEIQNFQLVFNHHSMYFKIADPKKIELFNKFKSMVMKSNIEFIYEGMIQYLDFVDHIDNNYLDTDIMSLISEANNILNKNLSYVYPRYKDRVANLEVNKINFSDILQKEGLKEFANYYDSTFTSKILNWHKENLNQANKIGLDISFFK